jgi:hypothetical protein
VLTEGCELAGESRDHQRLKLLIVDTARSLGWSAQPEAPGEGWRADVLATSPEGRRVVFEVQLSGQSIEETKRRTQNLTASGCEVVWITRRRTEWEQLAPTWRLANAFYSPTVSHGLLSYTNSLALVDVTRHLFKDALRWFEDERGWATKSGIAAHLQQAAERAEAERLAQLKREQHEKRSQDLVADIKRRTAARLKGGFPPPPRSRYVPPPATFRASGTANASDLERYERRDHALAFITRACVERGIQFEVRAPSEVSYGGAVVVVDGSVIVVEPTGLREGAWPDAVVVYEYLPARPSPADLTVTTAHEWASAPIFGSCPYERLVEYNQCVRNGTARRSA